MGLIFLVVLILQHSFANFMAIYGVKPNFIVIYIVFLSIKFGRLFGCIAGFFMGIIEDSLLTILFGLNALCKSFVGFIADNVHAGLIGNNLLDIGFLLFLASLVHNFLYNWIYSFGADVSAIFLLFRFALPGALYTALIGMIITAIFPKSIQLRYEKP
ncbi:MAG: rod shape-determining protein MreD [bacterium]